MVEILAADIQISPSYTCGYGTVHDSRGLGLRFPRFIKFREDKTPEECTNSSQIVEMYNQQAAVVNAKGGDEDEASED